MSEPVKHTPGPWEPWERRVPPGASFSHGVSAEGHMRCDVADVIRFDGVRGFDESAANANLIAAAPDLLAELERAVELLRIVQRHLPAWNEGDEADVGSMEAAIAKAKGL